MGRESTPDYMKDVYLAIPAHGGWVSEDLGSEGIQSRKVHSYPSANANRKVF